MAVLRRLIAIPTIATLAVLATFGVHGAEPAEAGGGWLVPWSAATPEALAADSAVLHAQLDVLHKSARPKPGKGDDIAVIVLDTVRADHLGMYGYAEKTTPNLDSWATGARVFTRATSDAPWTLPAHASMFTGQPSRTHGAISVGLEDPRKAIPLRESAVTIAERLHDAGYETVGIGANVAFLARTYGLSQGFDVWACEDLPDDPRYVPYIPGDRVTRLALDWLDEKSDRPRFFFVNYMDAHAPWIPREGFTNNPPGIRKKSLPFRKEWMLNIRSLMGKGILDPEVKTSWGLAYDAELRYLDSQLGQLLPKLTDFEHVFILADHGEALGEHNLVEHGKDIWEELVHVPYLVKSPKYGPGRDTKQVQSHDLAWMVLEAAKLPVPGDMVRTKDFAVSEQYYTLKKELEDKTFGAQFNHIRRAFRAGDTKVRVEDGKIVGTYDLATDPGERNGAVATPKAMVGIEASWLKTTKEAAPLPIDPAIDEDLEKLRALGYVQ